MADSVILIVEDEALAGLELRETLERMGYRIPVVVKRGEDVPEAIVVHKPDLILMDIRLKGFQDGIETAYMVGGEFEVPFIFLSAYSDDDTLKRALGTRAYGYLVKPFDEKTLRTTIELALRRSKEFRERDQDDWYKTVLSKFPRAVFLTDSYGRITFANEAARNVFPSSDTSKVGLALHMFFQEPAVVTDFLDEAASRKSADEPVARTLPLKNTHGALSLEASAFRDAEGKLTGYVVLANRENQKGK